MPAKTMPADLRRRLVDTYAAAIEARQYDEDGNRIDPANPWPRGCPWWFRHNEVYTRNLTRPRHRLFGSGPSRGDWRAA